MILGLMDYRGKAEPSVLIPMGFRSYLLILELIGELYHLHRKPVKKSDYLLLWTLREKKRTVQDTKLPEYFYMIFLIPIRLIFRFTSF